MDEQSRNLNYEKIVFSDWPSAVLIPALIGQYLSCLSNCEYLNVFFFFTASKKLLNIARFNFKKA